MQELLDKIRDLIVKSRLEGLTSGEQEILDAWRREDNKHEACYRRILTPENIQKQLNELDAIEVEKAFVQNQRLLRRRAFRRRMYRMLPYAAVLILLIGVAVLWPESPRTEPLLSAGQPIEPGTRQAELVLANGSSIRLNPGLEKTLQEGNTEVVIAGNSVNYTEAKEKAASSWHLIRTPLGGEYAITLADGTRVWLNALSELKYPVSFDGKDRRVELKGEAYFQVKADTARPFYVQVGDYRIEVVGTSFNVKAYEEDECWETTLCTGKVNLADVRNLQTVALIPGKQAVCNRKTQQLQVKDVDTDMFTAWTKGEFRFDNTSVEEIFTILQRWYKIDVFYVNSQVRREVFTGKLPRFDDLQVILNIMERVSDLHFERKGNTILIR